MSTNRLVAGRYDVRPTRGEYALYGLDADTDKWVFIAYLEPGEDGEAPEFDPADLDDYGYTLVPDDTPDGYLIAGYTYNGSAYCSASCLMADTGRRHTGEEVNPVVTTDGEYQDMTCDNPACGAHLGE